MSFWSNIDFKEPLKQYRWDMSIIDSYFQQDQKLNADDTNLIKYSLKECSKPEYEVSTTQHKLLTQTVTFPGLLKWKPINVKLASILNSKKTLDRLLEDMIRASGYKPLADYDFDNVEGSTNKEAIINSAYHQNIEKDRSFDISLIQYDVDGNINETWSLYNCFFSSVSYGKLSYSSEEIVEISLTIQYDWADQAHFEVNKK